MDERETAGTSTNDPSVAHEGVVPPEELDAGAAEDAGQDPLQAARDEVERYLNNWKRAEADLVNYRRRAEQDREDAVKYGNVHLLKVLLPLFDDLDRAIENAPAEVVASTWFEGLRLLQRKIAATLQSQGIEEIPAEGEAFDPNVHEAVLFEEGEEGQVTAAFQKGYRLHGRVVRPSLVRVGSGRPAASPDTAH